MLAKHGIEQVEFLMPGGPGETGELVLQSLAFAGSCPLDTIIAVDLHFYPYTTLAKIALDDGRIGLTINSSSLRLSIGSGRLGIGLRKPVKSPDDRTVQ